MYIKDNSLIHKGILRIKHKFKRSRFAKIEQNIQKEQNLQNK
jgi:hypothetical protein